MPFHPHRRCTRAPRIGSRTLTVLAGSLLLAGTNSAFAATSRSPMGGGDTITLEPVPARSAARPAATRRVVFTCVTPGLVIFSDRPCGPLPELRELRFDPVGGATARAGAGSAASHDETSARRDKPGTATSGAAAKVEPEDAAEREMRERAFACERLEQALHDLDQRMRAGYTAREAGRLWARWREAKERLRDARC